MQSVDGDIRLSAAISFNSKSLVQSSKELQKSVENIFTSVDGAANKSTAMRSLEIQMEKAYTKVNKLTEEFEALGRQEIPTPEMTKLEKDLDDASYKADHLRTKLNELENNPQRKRSAMKSGRLNALKKEYEDAVRMADTYAERINQLEESGNAYMSGSSTQAYKDMGVQLKQQISNLELLIQKHDELIAKEEESAEGTINLGASFKTLKNKGTSALQKLVKVLNGMFGVLGKVRNKFTQMFSHINKHSSFSLKKLIAYGLGIRSLYSLIRRLSTYATDAFRNLATQSTSFNAEVSSMMTGLAQLKGSLATAFQPIVSFVIPIINQLTAALNSCMNAIGKFFASLTGQGYIYKYTAAQQDFAGSLDDTGAAAAKAKKSLMGFDELNVLSDNSSGGGGGGGANAGTYEQVPVDPNSAIAEFTKKLKEAWKNGDFTEIGSIIGHKLKECLDSIPWNDIFDFSQRVGTSLGTFLTGFVTVPELANSIAKTVANAINTAMIGLDAFLTSTSWTDVGKFIADFANTAVTTFDWSLLGKTVANLILAAVNTWWTFVGNFDFSQLGTKISTAVNTTLSTLGEIDENGLSGWHKLGQSISKSVTGILDSIITALETINWSAVGTAIGQLISSIDWGKVAFNLATLVSALVTALGEAFMSWMETDPISAGIAGLLTTAFIGVKLAPIISTLSNLISGGAREALEEGLEEVVEEGIEEAFEEGVELVSLKEIFSNLGSKVSAAFSVVLAKLQPVFTAIGGFGSKLVEVFQLVSGGAGTLGEAISTVFGPMAQLISGIGSIVVGGAMAIGNFFEMLKDGFSWLREILMVVGIALAAVGAVILGAPALVAGVVAGIIAAVATLVIVVKDNWEAIKEAFKTALNAIKTAWNTAWTAIKTFFVNLFNSIVESVKTALNNMKTTITNVINNIKTGWTTAFNAIKTTTSNIFNGIKTTVTNIINAVKTGISNGLNSIKTAWNSVLNAIKTSTTNIFNGILTTIKKVINGIIGGINGMIKGIVSGINGIIRVLNKLSFKIPDWVPEMGGKKFGFNLSTVSAPQIPYLAKGAVIPPNKEFMAVLGDQKHGTNIEAPLDTIKQAVAEELSEYIDAMMAGFEAVVQAVNNKDLNVNIGDSAIGRAAERYNKRQSLVRGTL